MTLNTESVDSTLDIAGIPTYVKVKVKHLLEDLKDEGYVCVTDASLKSDERAGHVSLTINLTKSWSNHP